MKTLVLALCFMAVFEGILPLVAPAKWKQAVKTAADLPDAVLGSALLRCWWQEVWRQSG